MERAKNTTQNKTKARKARRRVLIIGKARRRVRGVLIVGEVRRREGVQGAQFS